MSFAASANGGANTNTPRAAAFLLGPSLIGNCIDLFLQGVVCGQVRFDVYSSGADGAVKRASPRQVVRYFDLSAPAAHDSRWLGLYVGVLTVLTIANSSLSFALLWRKCIINFGALDDPSDTNWTSAHLIVADFLAFYIQCYYLYRLFRFSNGHIWIVVPVGAALFAAFIISIVANAVRVQSLGMDIRVVALYDIYHPISMAGSIILTLTTASLLLRYRKTHNVLPANEHVAMTAQRLVFQTAVLPTLGSILTVIFASTFPEDYRAARSHATRGVSIVLTKLWAFSVMWTLNARVGERFDGDATSAEEGPLAGANTATGTTASGATRGPSHDGGRSRGPSHDVPRMVVKRRRTGDYGEDDDYDVRDAQMREMEKDMVTKPAAAKRRSAMSGYGHGPSVRFSLAASSTCASEHDGEGEVDEKGHGMEAGENEEERDADADVDEEEDMEEQRDEDIVEEPRVHRNEWR
ncbi:hypothetical protein HMN09_00853100 [Mycena chlorophos]|uniref:Uncharacterized protein n=1 Tax=Mycena chlorophos TaxID=658473 RepID=A0A8H6SR30_MYCCL|nr:hypothetical protein HMN09_00853100 [Mycena chlorophos]